MGLSEVEVSAIAAAFRPKLPLLTAPSPIAAICRSVGSKVRRNCDAAMSGYPTVHGYLRGVTGPPRRTGGIRSTTKFTENYDPGENLKETNGPSSQSLPVHPAEACDLENPLARARGLSREDEHPSALSGAEGDLDKDNATLVSSSRR